MEERMLLLIGFVLVTVIGIVWGAITYFDDLWPSLLMFMGVVCILLYLCLWVWFV